MHKLDKKHADALFGWLLAPARSLRKNPGRAFQSPDIAIDRMLQATRAECERKAAASGADSFQAWFVALADLVDQLPDDAWRLAKDNIIADALRSPEVARVWPIIDAADAQHRNAPLIAIPNPLGWSRAGFRAAGAVHRAAFGSGRGEIWARTTLEAYNCVAESVYVTYLVKLRFLHQLGSGVSLTPPPDFGPLCEQLAMVPALSALVDADAAHLRNAIAHGRYHYVGAGRLKLWEKDRPNRAAWTMSIEAVDVLERAIEMFVSAMGLMSALSAFASRTMFDVVGPNLPKFAAILRGELSAEEAARISQQEDARFAALFASVPMEAHLLRGAGEDRRLSDASWTAA